MKNCRTCLVDKPLTDFHRNHKAVDGLSYKCKPCAKKYMTTWRPTNQDAIRIQGKKWRTENREHYKQYMADWHSKNAEQIHERHRAWREANPTWHSEWKKAHPDRVNLWSTNRRAKARAQGYEKYDRAAIYQRDSGCCRLCSKPIDLLLPSSSKFGFTIDHIIPISRGGGDVVDNVQSAHRDCNLRKWAHV